MGFVDGRIGLGSDRTTRIYELFEERVQSREYKILDGGEWFTAVRAIANNLESTKDFRVSFILVTTIISIQLYFLLVYREFLAPGAPCEINIDGKTMEKVHQEMKNPSRFTFDAAQEHVYTLLLKKDCYPRFIRSEYYKNLLATGVQPSQKKR